MIRTIKPGQRIRLATATQDSPYAKFRRVTRVEPGMYRQTTIQFADGTYDTWGPDTEFVVKGGAR